VRLPAGEDICYATANRQRAVKALAPRADLVLVIGADNSSNSQRLKEVAAAHGTRGHLIPDASHLRPEWFEGVRTVVVTAGASAPEVLVRGVVDRLRELGATEVLEDVLVPENVRFPLPAAVARV